MGVYLAVGVALLVAAWVGGAGWAAGLSVAVGAGCGAMVSVAAGARAGGLRRAIRLR